MSLHLQRYREPFDQRNAKAGTGAGYDLSVTTFSPDGRVFQALQACSASAHGSDDIAA